MKVKLLHLGRGDPGAAVEPERAGCGRCLCPFRPASGCIPASLKKCASGGRNPSATQSEGATSHQEELVLPCGGGSPWVRSEICWKKRSCIKSNIFCWRVMCNNGGHGSKEWLSEQRGDARPSVAIFPGKPGYPGFGGLRSLLASLMGSFPVFEEENYGDLSRIPPHDTQVVMASYL